jgi:hypothetical protein
MGHKNSFVTVAGIQHRGNGLSIVINKVGIVCQGRNGRDVRRRPLLNAQDAVKNKEEVSTC